MRMQVGPEKPLQTIWGWKVAAYLFTAGMGAGACAMGAAGLLFAGWASRNVSLLAMWMGAIVVLASVLFLVWDLDRPGRFLGVLLKVRRSWLSRGAWILMAFGGFTILTLLLDGPVLLTWISLIFSLGVAIYTGLLIGTMLSRPLWNTPTLPALFLVSALSTGIALVVIGGLILSLGNLAISRELVEFGERSRTIHALLLSIELLVLYFFLSIAYGRSRGPVELLLRGQLARPFWGGVVVVGLVLPLLLEVLSITTGTAGIELALLAHAGVLIGGFMLRRVILLSGTRSPVQMGGSFVIRPEV